MTQTKFGSKTSKLEGFREKYCFGDVVLAHVYFVDMKETKKRPALVLFDRFDNVVVMGITSNPEMEGVPLSIADGMRVPSIIKTNYIFTLSAEMIVKKFFTLNSEKKKIVCSELGLLTSCF